MTCDVKIFEDLFQEFLYVLRMSMILFFLIIYLLLYISWLSIAVK